MCKAAEGRAVTAAVQIRPCVQLSRGVKAVLQQGVVFYRYRAYGVVLWSRWIVTTNRDFGWSIARRNSTPDVKGFIAQPKMSEPPPVFFRCRQ